MSANPLQVRTAELINHLQTTYLLPGIVSMRVVSVLRSAEIRPVYLRFVPPCSAATLSRSSTPLWRQSPVFVRSGRLSYGIAVVCIFWWTCGWEFFWPLPMDGHLQCHLESLIVLLRMGRDEPQLHLCLIFLWLWNKKIGYVNQILSHYIHGIMFQA